MWAKSVDVDITLTKKNLRQALFVYATDFNYDSDTEHVDNEIKHSVSNPVVVSSLTLDE
jgi:hypothetical protein